MASVHLSAGLENFTDQFQFDVSPSGAFSEALLKSNADGSYILTFAASQAADYLLDVSHLGVPLASLAIDVLPGPVSSASSAVAELQTGKLSNGRQATIIAYSP